MTAQQRKHMCVCVYVCALCACVCLCMCVFVHVCVFMCVFMYMCACMWVSCVCVCVCVYVWVCVCVGMCGYRVYKEGFVEPEMHHFIHVYSLGRVTEKQRSCCWTTVPRSTCPQGATMTRPSPWLVGKDMKMWCPCSSAGSPT